MSAGARFCRHCGTGLAGGVEALRELQENVPPKLASRILASRKRVRGERKLITALFVDIVGSTALAEKMDPEDWREIVDGLHRRVCQAVYRYEGTIAQLLGDGVLAFFGAPLAHEDDPERAVRSALAIQETVREYAEEIRKRVPDLKVRAGLNTGPVVVGDIGDDLHMEYLAVGDTVNLAARIQSAAEPGSILVSGETLRLAGPTFLAHDKGRIEVRGKTEPVQVFVVMGARGGAVRSRGIEGRAARLVGRQGELAGLRTLSGGLREGRGGVAVVIGEAGLGKTRLVAEWRKETLGEAPDIAWVEAHGLSYGRSLPYHFTAEILRGLIEAPIDAPRPEAALRGACARLGPDQGEEAYPFLAHLLGLSLDERGQDALRYLDGAGLRAKYAQAVRQLLRSLASRRPIVIICDDVHWADPSSVELGLDVLPITGEERIVVALTSRREIDSPGWQLVEQASAAPGALKISLSPLTSSQSAGLVRDLLQDIHAPGELMEAIEEKAEGNPFFIEEVVRMLITRGSLDRTESGWELAGRAIGEIPDTLYGVLTARIDRLPEEAKRVLQVASVIGRDFAATLLERVLNAQEAPDGSAQGPGGAPGPRAR